MHHKAEAGSKLWVGCEILETVEIGITVPLKLGVLVQLLPYGVKELANSLHVLFCWTRLTVMSQ
jgi:hypothetical protein